MAAAHPRGNNAAAAATVWLQHISGNKQFAAAAAAKSGGDGGSGRSMPDDPIVHLVFVPLQPPPEVNFGAGPYKGHTLPFCVVMDAAVFL